MNKQKLYWIFQIGGWSSYAILTIIAAPIITENQLDTPTLVLLISEPIFFFLITHAYRGTIIRREWLSKGMRWLIPRVIVSTIVMGFGIYLLRIGTGYLLGIFSAELYQLTTFLGLTTTNAFVLFLWSLFYFIYHYFERFNISLKYEAALNEIELNHLKSQLNPHFIFNALNSIRALVDDEPRKAKNAITQLSHILRNSLVTDRKRLTSFDSELKTVKDYLSLETIRYEERLATTFEIHPGSTKFTVPPLMLQTLVENGIKHGISHLKKGGFINLRTDVADSRLIIQIRNSGHYRNGESVGPTGFGLKNTKQRLSLIYGDEAKFKIKNENPETVLTEVIIPLKI